MAAEATAETVTESGHDRQWSVSVVMPAYNEAVSLHPLVVSLEESLAETAHQFEIIIVNDGSSDDTEVTIDRLRSVYPNVRAVHLARNYGQSVALKAGIDHARGEVIVTMDADGQNDPADIPALLDELERDGFDCVSGHRKNRQDPLAKRVPSRIQTALAKATGPDINDFGCTLKAYRADAIKGIQLYGEGHRYIPAKLYKQGYRIGEIDVNHRPRQNGESRYGVGRLLRGFVDLLYYYFDVHFSTRPMHILGGAGVLFMAVGGLIGLLSVIQKYAFGVLLAPRIPRLVLVAVLLVFGLQLVVFGVLAEMITRLQYRDEQPYRVERVVG